MDWHLLPFTKNFDQYFGGVQKILRNLINNSYTPPNILECNGVLYRNFTLNSLVLQVMTCYSWGGAKK